MRKLFLLLVPFTLGACSYVPSRVSSQSRPILTDLVTEYVRVRVENLCADRLDVEADTFHATLGKLAWVDITLRRYPTEPREKPLTVTAKSASGIPLGTHTALVQFYQGTPSRRAVWQVKYVDAPPPHYGNGCQA